MVGETRETLMTDRCLRQIYNWRVPPNWSRRDWHEEMKAEAIAAAWEAELDFDPMRGVPLRAFVHQRVLARVLTRHRREWAYARRCGLRSETDHCEDVTAGGPSSVDVSESLQHCLDRLPEHHRRLIQCLYWEGKTEVEVARMLSRSQPTINLRKRRILERLRRGMGHSEKEEFF
jgi:RNA polymerase sigma factor (sigma-70 family)